MDADEHTPEFVQNAPGNRRDVWEWIVTWVMREMLALPIWSWAFYRPTVIRWRGRKFKIARDLSVVCMEEKEE